MTSLFSILFSPVSLSDRSACRGLVFLIFLHVFFPSCHSISQKLSASTNNLLFLLELVLSFFLYPALKPASQPASSCSFCEKMRTFFSSSPSNDFEPTWVACVPTRRAKEKKKKHGPMIASDDLSQPASFINLIGFHKTNQRARLCLPACILYSLAPSSTQLPYFQISFFSSSPNLIK